MSIRSTDPSTGRPTAAAHHPTGVQRILFTGDMHGRIWDVDRVAARAQYQHADIIVQVGDFGYWPRDPQGKQFLRAVSAAAHHTSIPWWFIDGNHEDHDNLHLVPVDPVTGVAPITDKVSFIPRGYRWTWSGITFAAVSGATSVDRSHRVPGETWFPSEVLSPTDLTRIASAGPVDVVVAHECPHGVGFIDHRLNLGDPIPKRSQRSGWPASDLTASDQYRISLRRLADVLRPTWWVHGHHHVRYTDTLPGGGRIDGLGHEEWPVGDHTLLVDLADPVWHTHGGRRA